MSRGLGQLQRWILANLPPPNSGPGGKFADLASPAELAAAYYGAKQPTDAQLTAVRRALRGLEEQDLATRWSTRILNPGNPSRWSQPAPLTGGCAGKRARSDVVDRLQIVAGQRA